MDKWYAIGANINRFEQITKLPHAHDINCIEIRDKTGPTVISIKIFDFFRAYIDLQNLVINFLTRKKALKHTPIRPWQNCYQVAKKILIWMAQRVRLNWLIRPWPLAVIQLVVLFGLIMVTSIMRRWMKTVNLYLAVQIIEANRLIELIMFVYSRD